MKTTSLLRSSLVLFALGLTTACAPDAAAPLTVVSQAEVGELAQGCAALLSSDDEDIVWARVADRDAALVLDTPNGSCVDEREHVLSLLQSQHRLELAALIAADFHFADPSPHPDITDRMLEADPSPHPDQPQDTSADPSPHPDKDGASDDDGSDPFEIEIVIVIEIEIVPPAGDTPAPAPAPAPTTGAAEGE